MFLDILLCGADVWLCVRAYSRLELRGRDFEGVDIYRAVRGSVTADISYKRFREGFDSYADILGVLVAINVRRRGQPCTYPRRVLGILNLILALLVDNLSAGNDQQLIQYR